MPPSDCLLSCKTSREYGALRGGSRLRRPLAPGYIRRCPESREPRTLRRCPHWRSLRVSDLRIGDYGQIRAVDLYNILFAPVDVGFADERRAGAGRRESKGYLAVLFVVSGIVRSSRVFGRRLGTGLKSQGEGANPCEQM